MIRGIGAIVALAAVTVLTWSQATSMGNMPEQRLVSQLVGAVALTGFAAEFFLATRHRVLDTLFGGLDKAYVVHKWLG
ncbi:MAG: hypothetical protein FWC46_05355, partial [Actinomycetia bacterium]|nr:hypothetical protein [Actinomycetes bacterium]